MTTIEFAKGVLYHWLLERSNGEEEHFKLKCAYRRDNRVCLTDGTNSKEFKIQRTIDRWTDKEGKKHALKAEYVVFRTRKLLAGPIIVNEPPVKAGGTAHPIEVDDPETRTAPPEIGEHIYKTTPAPQTQKSGQLFLPF